MTQLYDYYNEQHKLQNPHNSDKRKKVTKAKAKPENSVVEQDAENDDVESDDITMAQLYDRYNKQQKQQKLQKLHKTHKLEGKKKVIVGKKTKVVEQDAEPIQATTSSTAVPSLMQKASPNPQSSPPLTTSVSLENLDAPAEIQPPVQPNQGLIGSAVSLVKKFTRLRGGGCTHSKTVPIRRLLIVMLLALKWKQRVRLVKQVDLLAGTGRSTSLGSDPLSESIIRELPHENHPSVQLIACPNENKIYSEFIRLYCNVQLCFQKQVC